MTIIERINKKLEPWGLTVEDLTEEELAEAKECLKPGTIDGFFTSNTVLSKSLKKKFKQGQ